MSTYFQHVGVTGGDRDFPKTVGTLEQGLVRFEFEQIKLYLSHLSPAEVADIGRTIAEQVPNGFQIWGIPAGARAVLRDMRNDDWLLLLKTVGLKGTFDYVGRVVAHLPGEFAELSQYLWGEVQFPLIVLLDGHLLDYPWVDFCEAFGYNPIWNPAGRTHLLQSERIEGSSFHDADSFVQYLIDSPSTSDVSNGSGDQKVEALDTQRAAIEATPGLFDPTSTEDARERTLRAIVQRQGQPLFRDTVLKAYGYRCAITNCDAVPALEAAHIIGYNGPDTNHVSNGLLLRADIHTLFDMGLITIDTATMSVHVAPSLAGTVYSELAEKPLRVPIKEALRPSKVALDQHREDLGHRRR